MKVYAVMLDTDFGGVICHDILSKDELDAIEEVNRLNSISQNGLYYVKELEIVSSQSADCFTDELVPLVDFPTGSDTISPQFEEID